MALAVAGSTVACLRWAKHGQTVSLGVKFILKFGLGFAFGEQLKTQSLKLAFSKYSCF